MISLPALRVDLPQSFQAAPVCGVCLEDDERTPASFIVDDLPMCTDHAHEETGL